MQNKTAWLERLEAFIIIYKIKLVCLFESKNFFFFIIIINKIYFYINLIIYNF